MTASHKYEKKGPKCYNCGKFGHIKRNCRAPLKTKSDSSTKQKAHTAKVESDDESVGLVVQNAMSSHTKTDSWIVDSGAIHATCVIAAQLKLCGVQKSGHTIEGQVR